VQRAVGGQRRVDRLLEQRQAFGEAGAVLEVVEQRRQAVLERTRPGRGAIENWQARRQFSNSAIDRLQRLAIAALARRLRAGAASGGNTPRARPRSRAPAASLEPQRGELLHQRMQVHAVALLGEQRLVGERAQHRQRGAGDRARAPRSRSRRERPRAGPAPRVRRRRGAP
jgi:hypothetical protein